MKALIIILLLFPTFIACNNDKKTTTTEAAKENSITTTNNNSTSSVSGDNTIVFTVDGTTVQTLAFTITLADIGTNIGTKTLNITSDNYKDPRTIKFNVNAEMPGTYPIIPPGIEGNKAGVATGSYRPDFTNDIANGYSFQSGEITIISIDLNKRLLNATFHGVAKNANGETVTITDGNVINGKIIGE